MIPIQPTWAPKVSPVKIRQLYTQDAAGIQDDELIDDVGCAIYARCDSMHQVTLSNMGRPVCFVCRTPMPHSYDKAFLLQCPQCNWSITVGEYGASYKNRTLNGSGVLPELERFLKQYPLAITYADKMRLIDGLIHTFHGNLSAEPSRPVAVNLIDGNIGEVANLIFTLAYGEGSTASAEALTDWLEVFNRSISRNIDPATGTLKPGVHYVYEGIGKKGRQV